MIDKKPSGGGFAANLQVGMASLAAVKTRCSAAKCLFKSKLLSHGVANKALLIRVKAVS